MKKQPTIKTNRRKFIQNSSLGLAGLATWNWKESAQAADSDEFYSSSLATQALIVPGLHAYTTEKSVEAGEDLAFHVSSTLPYKFSICRLGQDVDSPDRDETLLSLGEFQVIPQPIYPGSYITVEKGLPNTLNGLSLECWVRPLKTDVQTSLISQYDFPNHCGYNLSLNEKGGITIYLGDGQKFRPEFVHHTKDNVILADEWHHIVATFDGAKIIVWVNGVKVDNWTFFPIHPPVIPGKPILRLAADANEGRTSHTLDGDLAMPTVYRRALVHSEILQRFGQKGLYPAQGNHVLACWKLDEEKGAKIKDCSGNKRHGAIVNHGTWMVGGPSFDANVARYGDHKPSADSNRGHGLRLASDDLYDCGWREVHHVKIPKQAQPGIYVGRFEFDLDGKSLLYDTTFVVKRYRKNKKAPLLVVCATNTWLAYNGTPLGVNSADKAPVFSTQGGENSPGDPPAFNLYRSHAQGQGTYQVGLRMPWPAAGPYVRYGKDTDYSHLVRAERFTHAWLEKAGYPFDVITDLDLHRDPKILKNYQAVMLNGHSEYWSIPMYEGLKKYLEKDGHLICLSGNSLFWRVSFDEEGSVMECRKADAPGHQVRADRRGEHWHSQDGLKGGLLRECGFPGWNLVGLETLGWNNHNDPEQFGAFEVAQAGHLLFNRPLNVGVEKGQKFGESIDGNLPKANGHEMDVRIATLKSLQKEPAPPGTFLPDEPAGMVTLATGVMDWSKGGSAFDYFMREITPESPQGGEMVYWERPEGGKVFNAGSIGAGWALNTDAHFQKLMVNVLTHFGIGQHGIKA